MRGSPPRMRGKRAASSIIKLHPRITPADAGKTSRRAIPCTRGQHHPRGCGENVLPERTEPSSRGSPPRMRGKRAFLNDFTILNRITPADAGKTRQYEHATKSNEDHPRGCGENSPVCKVGRNERGSPPRMRGKPTEAADRPESWRITPADAGKTSTSLYARFKMPDHPRGCGENPATEEEDKV